MSLKIKDIYLKKIKIINIKILIITFFTIIIGYNSLLYFNYYWNIKEWEINKYILSIDNIYLLIFIPLYYFVNKYLNILNPKAKYIIIFSLLINALYFFIFDLNYYIYFSIIYLSIFLESIYYIIKKSNIDKWYFKTIQVSRLLFYITTIIYLFLSKKISFLTDSWINKDFYIYEFIEDRIINNTIINNWNDSWLNIFYNPTLPLIDLSFIQIIIIIIMFLFIYELKNIYSLIFNKKNLKYIIILLVAWIILRFSVTTNQIWQPNKADLLTNYSLQSDFLAPINYINKIDYWVVFHDILNIISRITPGIEWDVFSTMYLNRILDIVNIFMFFLFTLLLWWNRKIAFWSSLFYVTSISVLRFTWWEHMYIFMIFFYLLLFINLLLFNKNWNSNNYLSIILITIVLINMHHIAILTPVIVILFLLIFLNKKILSTIIKPQFIVLYMVLSINIIWLIKSKFHWDYLWWDQIIDYSLIAIIKHLFVEYSFFDINNPFYKILFSKWNPFFALDNNSSIVMILFIISLIAFIFIKIKDKTYKIKIFTFFILTYIIMAFPYYYSMKYILKDRDNNIIYPPTFNEIQTKLDYNNSMYADHLIKWLPTIPIWLCFMGFLPFIILKSIKNKKYKEITSLLIFISIFSIPIINRNKINYYLNQQVTFDFLNNNLSQTESNNIIFITEYQQRLKVRYDLFLRALVEHYSLWETFIYTNKDLINTLNTENKIIYFKHPNCDIKNDEYAKKLSIDKSLLIVKYWPKFETIDCSFYEENKKNLVPIVTKQIKCSVYWWHTTYCAKDTITIWLYEYLK